MFFIYHFNSSICSVNEFECLFSEKMQKMELYAGIKFKG